MTKTISDPQAFELIDDTTGRKAAYERRGSRTSVRITLGRDSLTERLLDSLDETGDPGRYAKMAGIVVRRIPSQKAGLSA